MNRQLVAGIDSSTQSVKVTVYDALTGELVREARRPHPPGTSVDPEEWWLALLSALDAVGGLDEIRAISIAGQQHGLITLDEDGRVIRPALLWNDTRSASAAEDLTNELGAVEWAHAVGLVPVASFTISKLRWLADHEPENARRVVAVCLPHDWLTWRLSGSTDVADLTTDRSDASGTGYFDPRSNEYRRDLLQRAFGRDLHLPRVIGPRDALAGPRDVVLGAGGGDNAAAHFGLGDADATVVSLGTSGVVMRRATTMPIDPTGSVAGFADLTGQFLPLVCTLNCARVLDSTAELLGVDLGELSALALAAPPAANGLTLVPYFEGERTPNRPHATGTLAGLTLESWTKTNLARASVEGVLRGVGAGLAALEELGIAVGHCVIVGGAGASLAVQSLAPSVWGREVRVAPVTEYVARGAARQAAWALSDSPTPPSWALTPEVVLRADSVDHVADERYQRASSQGLERPAF
ncbi:MAG: xylulose kinase [Acidimicrobiaceae bacterium]|nr:xylulose kinase [Acidimicrobiaceae bacterium]